MQVSVYPEEAENQYPSDYKFFTHGTVPLIFYEKLNEITIATTSDRRYQTMLSHNKRLNFAY